MPASKAGDPLAAARWLDVVVVVAAAPFVVLADLPVIGYAAGAGAWIVARLIGALVERHTVGKSAKTAAGLTIFSGMGRAWLVGLAVLVTGLSAERQDGLTAALLVLFAFTVYLATGFALRPRPGSTSTT